MSCTALCARDSTPDHGQDPDNALHNLRADAEKDTEFMGKILRHSLRIVSKNQDIDPIAIAQADLAIASEVYPFGCDRMKDINFEGGML